MADKLTKAQRSALMGRIKRSNTNPEMAVRRLLSSLGYRYRIQLAAVPGRPDVAFTKRKKAVFIHGCFWHMHGCGLSRVPKTRTGFWLAKFRRNQERDARLLKAAKSSGWRCLVVWECEVRSLQKLERRLTRFLGPVRIETS